MKKLVLFSSLAITLFATAANLAWMAINDVEFDKVVIGRVTDGSVVPWQNGIYIGYEKAATQSGATAWQGEAVRGVQAEYDSEYGYYNMGEFNVEGFYDVQNAYYYMELYNSDARVAYSDLVTYNIIKHYVDTQDYWMVSNFQPVPEPSSGLLLLIGGALVGLRRKRRVA